MQFKLVIVVVALFHAALADEGNVAVQASKGWLQTGAEIAKDAIGMGETGTHLGAQITSAAGSFGTGLGNAALQGGLQMGQMGIGAGADLAKQGIGLMDKMGGMLPGPFKTGVQSMTGMATGIVDKVEGLGKNILGQVGVTGDKAFKWSDKTISGVAGKVDSTVSGITGSMKNGIDTGANAMEQAFGNLKNIISGMGRKPVTA